MSATTDKLRALSESPQFKQKIELSNDEVSTKEFMDWYVQSLSDLDSEAIMEFLLTYRKNINDIFELERHFREIRYFIDKKYNIYHSRIRNIVVKLVESELKRWLSPRESFSDNPIIYSDAHVTNVRDTIYYLIENHTAPSFFTRYDDIFALACIFNYSELKGKKVSGSRKIFRERYPKSQDEMKYLEAIFTTYNAPFYPYIYSVLIRQFAGPDDPLLIQLPEAMHEALNAEDYCYAFSKENLIAIFTQFSIFQISFIFIDNVYLNTNDNGKTCIKNAAIAVYMSLQNPQDLSRIGLPEEQREGMIQYANAHIQQIRNMGRINQPSGLTGQPIDRMDIDSPRPGPTVPLTPPGGGPQPFKEQPKPAPVQMPPSPAMSGNGTFPRAFRETGTQATTTSTTAAGFSIQTQQPNNRQQPQPTQFDIKAAEPYGEWTDHPKPPRVPYPIGGSQVYPEAHQFGAATGIWAKSDVNYTLTKDMCPAGKVPICGNMWCTPDPIHGGRWRHPVFGCVPLNCATGYSRNAKMHCAKGMRLNFFEDPITGKYIPITPLYLTREGIIIFKDKGAEKFYQLAVQIFTNYDQQVREKIKAALEPHFNDINGQHTLGAVLLAAEKQAIKNIQMGALTA